MQTNTRIPMRIPDNSVRASAFWRPTKKSKPRGKTLRDHRRGTQSR